MQAAHEGVPTKVKPKLRGVFHFLGFFTALGGCAFLAMAPAEGTQYVAGLVYGGGLCLMLALSALYHRPTWSHRARSLLRRMDHAGVFALIGGTFTPVAVLRAGGRWDAWVTGMWAACLLGMVLMVVFSHMHRSIRAAIYVTIGLIAAPMLYTMPGLIGWWRVGLLYLGAGIYILGAGVYARRWPNPDPTFFGYHEFFHLMTLAAAGLHFGVVLDLQSRP
jgi:hemolysin III